MAALRGVIVDCLWVGIPAALTVMLLWPALWIAPAQNIGRVLGLMETYGQTGHELGNFWLGKAVASPGGLFYGAVIVWRTTPLTLIGGALALVFTLNLAWRGRGDDDARSSTAAALGVDRRTLLGLWVFVVWYVVILSLGDKKFDRYLLPIFLVVDLLAAFGWVALVKLWQRGRSSARSQPQTWYALIGGAAHHPGLDDIRLNAVVPYRLQPDGGWDAHGAPGDAGRLGRRDGRSGRIHQ